MIPQKAIQLVAATNPDLVLDLGASDGRWSRFVAQHLPSARFVCVDPVEYPDRWEDPRVQWVNAAVARRSADKAPFFVSPDKFGSGFYPGSSNTTVRAVTLVSLIPDDAKRVFIKYDLHGAEVSTFHHLCHFLNRLQAVQIECYNYDVGGRHGWHYHNVAEYIEALDFRTACMFDQLDRGDGTLWQMDLLFLRRNHPVFARGDYFA